MRLTEALEVGSGVAASDDVITSVVDGDGDDSCSGSGAGVADGSESGSGSVAAAASASPPFSRTGISASIELVAVELEKAPSGMTAEINVK